MKPRLELVQDVDYADTLAELNRVICEMNRKSPTGELLLKQAWLEFRLGNFHRARRRARDSRIMTQNPESYYLQALCEYELALVAAELAVQGFNDDSYGDISDTRTHLLASHEALGVYFQLQREDEEAMDLMSFIESMLATQDAEASLQEAYLDA